MKKIIWICLATLLVYINVGCSRVRKMPEGLIKRDSGEVEENEDENSNSPLMDEGDVKDGSDPIALQSVNLYFWDKKNNKLECEAQNIVTSDMSLFINESIKALIRGPKSQNLQPVIPKNTKIIGVKQTDNIVTVDLSEEFLKAEDLLIGRTALINTITEREEIKYVKITINGEELTSDGTPEGQPLGVLSKMTNNIDELIAAEKREPSEDTAKQINRELYFRDFRGRYLLSEVRQINVKNDDITRAIVEELIKGPVETSGGLYPVMPQGTKLLDIKLQEGNEDGKDGDPKIVSLYFSKEIKTPFLDQETSRGVKLDPNETQDRAEQIDNKEKIILSSIVYSLSDLKNVDGVKIYYQNKYGSYVDDPLYNVNLKKPLTVKDFPDRLGRRIKVYFANSNASHLLADYRAMSKENVQIAKTIIDELILGPRKDTEQKGIIPSEVSQGDIRVWMDENNTRVMVDLPGKVDGNKMGSSDVLMTLYAIVNSLTDPVNTSNIKEVQFLVDGKIVKTFGNLEFSEPFTRNTAIIEK